MSRSEKALKTVLVIALIVVVAAGLYVWSLRVQVCRQYTNYPAWQCWLLTGR